MRFVCVYHSFECQHLIHTIQAAGIKKWCCLMEGAGHTVGWLTTNERKEAMCMQVCPCAACALPARLTRPRYPATPSRARTQVRDALRVGSIAFSAQFFSTTQGIREVKQQLEDECRNFCIVRERL